MKYYILVLSFSIWSTVIACGQNSDMKCLNDNMGKCPLWMPNSTAENKSSEHYVKCSRDEHGDYYMSVLPCYCMTQYRNSSTAVVGLCPFTCTEYLPLLNYRPLPAHVNVSGLALAMCKQFHRRGQICGQCEDGYAPAVYSYTLNCTNHKISWLKYIGMAFGPQTIFFVIIVVSRTSVTSGLMVGYVTVSQLLATAIELRFKAVEVLQTKAKILYTVYGVWNLDFFRALYTPSCLNFDLSPLAVISLDYAVAVYPMCLIMVAYLVVTLCDRFKYCTPFHHLIFRYYQMCDIRNSIMDAFVTMLILSYVKILNTSFELLLQARLIDQDGRMKETVVYYQGNLIYFGKQHLPYAVLAIVMSLIFNIFPLVWLTLYPCRCFQRCLNMCWSPQRSAPVHNLMDDFYRCYRTTPRDCRCFAALYLYLRIINLSLLFIALSPVYFILISILYLSMAFLIALSQPYKVYWHNVVNAGLLFIVAIIKILEFTLEFSVGIYEHDFVKVYLDIEVFLFHVPPLYGLVVLLLHQIIPQKIQDYTIRKIHHVFSKFLQKLKGEDRFEESFAHRLSHADEYTHLINVN